MGSKPRLIQEGYIIATTQRTVDRQFLTKPTPAIRNLVGACAARAMHKYPVKLYWLDMNINHEHMGLAPIDGSDEALSFVAKFKQLYHRLLACELNRMLGREGALFSSASRDVICLDNEAAEAALGYAITNPVKDGLVERAAHWKGYSSYQSLALGENPAYTFIDWKAWREAGGKRSGKEPSAFTRSIHLNFTPLPGTEHLTSDQRRARIRRQCRELEQKFREEREREGRRVLSAARLEKLDHRDRPASPAEKRRKPLCRATSPEAVAAYTDTFKAFVQAYREASVAYRSGLLDVVFPRGSFRPPLIEAAG